MSVPPPFPGGSGPASRESADCIAQSFDRHVRKTIKGDPLPEPSPISVHLLEMLDDVAELRPTVLDLGCGTGASAIELARRGARLVTGIDLSPLSIETARRRATAAGVDETRARFSVGDAASTRLETHDWVVMDRVICCYLDAERLLDNALGATGSRLAFCVPESRGWRGVLNAVTWGAENLWNAISPRCECDGRIHDVDAIEERIRSAGLGHGRSLRRGLWYAAVMQRPSAAT